MLDAMVKLLGQVQFKSQLSPEMEREYCVRFGTKKYYALPNAPKPKEQRVGDDI